MTGLLLLALACLLARAGGVSCGETHKLGENFQDWSVPERAAATVGESLGFAVLVVGVLAVASAGTYFKVKSNPGKGLPGYSQAIYMREQQ